MGIRECTDEQEDDLQEMAFEIESLEHEYQASLQKSEKQSQGQHSPVQRTDLICQLETDLQDGRLFLTVRSRVPGVAFKVLTDFLNLSHFSIGMCENRVPLHWERICFKESPVSLFSRDLRRC